MKFKFDYKGKIFELDVEKCENVFSQCLGLMFGLRKKPLLFIFKKPTRQLIHSFFCRPFVAIWFDGDRVVDVRLVNEWKCFIRPKSKFDKLLEIPSGNKDFEKFHF